MAGNDLSSKFSVIVFQEYFFSVCIVLLWVGGGGALEIFPTSQYIETLMKYLEKVRSCSKNYPNERIKIFFPPSKLKKTNYKEKCENFYKVIQFCVKTLSNSEIWFMSVLSKITILLKYLTQNNIFLKSFQFHRLEI